MVASMKTSASSRMVASCCRRCGELKRWRAKDVVEREEDSAAAADMLCWGKNQMEFFEHRTNTTDINDSLQE